MIFNQSGSVHKPTAAARDYLRHRPPIGITVRTNTADPDTRLGGGNGYSAISSPLNSCASDVRSPDDDGRSSKPAQDSGQGGHLGNDNPAVPPDRLGLPWSSPRAHNDGTILPGICDRQAVFRPPLRPVQEQYAPKIA